MSINWDLTTGDDDPCADSGDHTLPFKYFIEKRVVKAAQIDCCFYVLAPGSADEEDGADYGYPGDYLVEYEDETRAVVKREEFESNYEPVL